MAESKKVWKRKRIEIIQAFIFQWNMKAWKSENMKEKVSIVLSVTKVYSVNCQSVLLVLHIILAGVVLSIFKLGINRQCVNLFQSTSLFSEKANDAVNCWVYARGCVLIIFSGMIFFLYLATLVSLSLAKRNVLLLVADDFRQIHEFFGKCVWFV